jgi:hypothetical protein
MTATRLASWWSQARHREPVGLCVSPRSRNYDSEIFFGSVQK